MKNKFKFLGAVQGIASKIRNVCVITMITAIALSTTGCPEPDNKITPTDNTPTSVTVTAPSETVAQNGSFQFTAAVSPSEASQAVTWSITPGSAGSISESGLLIPTANPGTQITVRAASVSHPAVFGTKNVTVAQPVTPTSVTVTAPAATISQGGSWQFRATVGPTGAPQAVTWSIEPENAGTISESGLLIPTAEPGSQITVKATAANHSSVSGTTTVTVGQPVTPTSITITPSTASVVQGGYFQFSATVSPAEAPQAVKWSVSPDTNASIDESGYLYVYSDATGTLTVTATAANHPSVSRTATVTVLQPIIINVTNIPNDYHNHQIDIELRSIVNGSKVAYSGNWVEDSSVSFTLWDNNDYGLFATPGNYEVRLTLYEDEDWENKKVFRIASKYFPAGESTISFSDFTLIQPIIINIAGVPSDYLNSEFIQAQLLLLNPGWTNVYNDYVEIDGASPASTTSFTLTAPAGNYDIILAFTFGDGGFLQCYRTTRNLTAGTNDIAFSQFTVVPPSISLTVTNIPTKYNNCFAFIQMSNPSDYGYGGTQITGSSGVFKFWFTNPGTYEMTLMFYNLESDELEGEYYIISRNITATATIPYTDFTFTGSSMSITITGIPQEYLGNWGYLEISPSGQDDWRYESSDIESSSVTFKVIGIPGNYDLKFSVYINQSNRNYAITRNITATGTTIAYSDFTPQYTILTITGIPGNFQDASGQIVILDHNTGDEISYNGFFMMGETTVTVDLGKDFRGTYNARLEFEIYEPNYQYFKYFISSVKIDAAKTTLAFSSFTPPITITVTDIPEKYYDYNDGQITLNTPGSQDSLTSTSTYSVTASTTFVFDFFTQGTYDVNLTFNLYQDSYSYLLSSANITAENELSYTDFEPLYDDE